MELFFQHGPGAVQKEPDEDDGNRSMADVSRDDRRDGGPKGGRQLEGHGQPDIGDVAFHVNRGRRGRSCNDRHQACGDCVRKWDMKEENEDGRDDDPATNAGYRAEASGEEADDDEDQTLFERQGFYFYHGDTEARRAQEKGQTPVEVWPAD